MNRRHPTPGVRRRVVAWSLGARLARLGPRSLGLDWPSSEMVRLRDDLVDAGSPFWRANGDAGDALAQARRVALRPDRARSPEEIQAASDALAGRAAALGDRGADLASVLADRGLDEALRGPAEALVETGDRDAAGVGQDALVLLARAEGLRGSNGELPRLTGVPSSSEMTIDDQDGERRPSRLSPEIDQ